jgi:hypothetical protein
MRIFAAATDGSATREVCALDGLWNFACSWEHDVLLASVGRSEPGLWRMDLWGKDARRVLSGSLVSELQVAPDGGHAIYHLQSAVWSLDLTSGKAQRIIDHGKGPALSPSGRAVAFKRGEHDLFIQELGWSFEHRVGIVDFETREVWMEEGHWSDVAWRPVK